MCHLASAAVRSPADPSGTGPKVPGSPRRRCISWRRPCRPRQTCAPGSRPPCGRMAPTAGPPPRSVSSTGSPARRPMRSGSGGTARAAGQGPGSGARLALRGAPRSAAPRGTTGTDSDGRSSPSVKMGRTGRRAAPWIRFRTVRWCYLSCVAGPVSPVSGLPSCGLPASGLPFPGFEPPLVGSSVSVVAATASALGSRPLR